MLLAKSRPIVAICIADGSHFARECLTAFTPWHLDAVSGSHPPHLLSALSGSCAPQGSTPFIFVTIRLYMAAARRSPRSDPQNSHDFRPRALPLSPRSAALLDRHRRPSSRNVKLAHRFRM